MQLYYKGLIEMLFKRCFLQYCLVLPHNKELVKKVRIAVLASGTGTNAQKLMEHFKQHISIEVALVISNKATAGVHHYAAAKQVPSIVVKHSNDLLLMLKQYAIEWVVLAGFLKLIPKELVEYYPNKIINIHPALLPKFGGKGMYGNFVHQAVKDANEKESGITIHFVNEVYDEGKTIFQASCKLLETDTTEGIQQKVMQLEHKYFPQIVEQTILN